MNDFGSTKTRTSSIHETRDRAPAAECRSGCCSSDPEQPPPCTPRRKSAFGGRNILLRHGRANTRQRLLRHLDALGGRRRRLHRIFNVDRAHSRVGRAAPAGTARHLPFQFTPAAQPRPARLCLACVLLLPVADGGANRIFRQHRAVDLHRRQATVPSRSRCS